MNLEFAPTVKINPNNLILYSDYNFDKSKPYYFGRKEIKEQSLENLSKNKYVGVISVKGQQRLKRTVDYMLYNTKQKNLKLKSKQQKYLITFVTLTLPSKQVHSDNVIKSKCLNQFLIEMSKKGVQNYIWKAEKQNNNNIHFHLLFDKFIEWQIIRSVWNRIVEKLNYVSVFSENMKKYYCDGFKYNSNDKRSYDKQKKSYSIGLQSNFTNPNSTDIHKINKVRNLRSYISKYIAKNDNVNKNKIDGRLWFCSGELSKLKGLNEIIDSKLYIEIEKIIEENRVFVSDYATIVNFDIDNYKTLRIYTLFQEYLSNINKPKEQIQILTDFNKLANDFENNIVKNDVQTIISF